MQRFKKYLPHIGVFVLFVIISLAYFSPVLQGKKIFQSDIVQYTGMAKQQNDFRKTTGEETYWTNSAFGGMPTYQLGAKYPHNYIKKLDLTIRFLPRPADYLFLYFIGMYILFLVLKINYKLAFVGALAFGFSTYLIIILGVGHNAKAHAIAYMPLVLSGIILTFRKKYLYGFLLTTIAMALELVTNHFQMTYYLMLLVIVIGIVYLIDSVKNKTLPQYFKAVGIMAAGVLLAIGMNATNILATKEYADTSTRGKSELTVNADGSPKEANKGLDYNYITEYSYGKLESFNLFIPRFMGGGNSEPLPDDPKTLDAVMQLGASPQEANQLLNQVPMYWGDQPIVAAPAYVGAVIIFLAILALFLIKGKMKWWLTAGFLLSLFLSWGKNFSLLTDFFIDNIPLYNKFRAVSSIQVLLEMILPILAIVGLHHFFFKASGKSETRKKALLYATGITGGVALIFILFKSSLFSFSSPYDSYFMKDLGPGFVDAMREDRMTLFMTDSIRSLVFVLISAGVLWLFLKEKLKLSLAIGILGLLIIIDLVGVDRRYVNNDDFVMARVMDHPFQENFADKEILKDNGYYRVYDITSNPFNSGRASYYHNALGGYHAAKPGRMQDIDDFYLSKGDVGILNMMNVKYIITQSKNGTEVPQRNPYANGPAWLVKNVMFAENANEEIKFLDSLDTKKTAIINREFKVLLPLENIQRDSTATIKLLSHSPNHLKYESETNSPQLALFSEVYYPKGWNAYIDGELTNYFRANYILRAMTIPEGKHTIEFKFEPQVVATGSKISLASSILFVLVFVGGVVFLRRQESHETESLKA
ncbi:MAG: YfhO family protein [Flavobacteriaceae bacterium]|nr:YfhO family protein [Flavobacteriaceae bacterium]